MVFPIYPEMIPNHDAFRSPTPPLPRILPHAQTGLTGPIFPGNDTEKLQKIRLSVRDGERSNFYAENEQKAQAGMAVLLKPPKPYDIQSALPKMCSQLQTEFPGHRDGLPALSVQAGKKELLMSNEKIARINAADSGVPLPTQENEFPALVTKIGKTTYRVTIHFSATSQETMSDKIKRILRNEISHM